MKRILIILIIGFVFSTVQAQMDNPLKKGMPNTVTLSTGNVIYNLNGEWDAIFDNAHYGGISKDVIKITQEGNKFLGIRLIGTVFHRKGSETIKGELEGDGFKSLYGFNLPHGWTLSKGKISDGGKKIVIEEPIQAHDYTAIITLTRK
ncbi:MAG: hypothetical protein JSV31_30240 [Desulfobacterales bacterium]|nr:MAG: hypothetical protein JSV31_30240 [Desulfobacterales bacterium]